MVKLIANANLTHALGSALLVVVVDDGAGAVEVFGDGVAEGAEVIPKDPEAVSERVVE